MSAFNLSMRFLALIFCAVFISGAGAAIPGLSFSSDTVYGWRVIGEPHKLTITNDSPDFIPVDSVVLLNRGCDTTLLECDSPAETTGTGHWYPIAYGSLCPGLKRPSTSVSPRSKGTMHYFKEEVVSHNPALGKTFAAGVDTLAAVFCSGAESDTVVFLVRVNGTEIIEEGSVFARADGGLSIVPNPCRLTVRMELPGGAGFGEVEIFNVKGERVFRESGIKSNSFVWRTANIMNGVYLVRCGQGKRGWTGKVVVYR